MSELIPTTQKKIEGEIQMKNEIPDTWSPEVLAIAMASVQRSIEKGRIKEKDRAKALKRFFPLTSQDLADINNRIRAARGETQI